MSNKVPKVFQNPIHKPNPGVIFKNVLGGTFLLGLLILVSLPMVWMILTAFKQKGRGFEMSFIPSTQVYYPSETGGYILPIINEGERYLHVEVEDNSAINVQAKIKSPDNEYIRTADFISTGFGFWMATIGPLSEEVTVNVLLDGKDQTQLIGGDSEGINFSLSEGMNFPTGDRLAIWYEDDMVNVETSLEALEQFDLIYEGTKYPGNNKIRNVSLTRYSASFLESSPSFSAHKVQLVTHRPFGEALSSLYTIDNFSKILNNPDFKFGRYFFNSLVVATSAALLTVLLTTLAGYGFAQKRFTGREILFKLLLSSMLVPGMIYMVPQFSITLSLGWLNSYTGMVVPHVANVFGLYLLRQYIEQVPDDLFRAAEIDGANDFQIFRNIVIPMTLPVMVTLFLLVFVGQWSNFLWQLIVNTGDQATMTLPVGLQQFKGQNATDWELIMAGACFSILPITVLFLSLQHYFVMGLTAGSVKE